jgi:hypothetical protein
VRIRSKKDKKVKTNDYADPNTVQALPSKQITRESRNPQAARACCAILALNPKDIFFDKTNS